MDCVAEIKVSMYEVESGLAWKLCSQCRAIEPLVQYHYRCKYNII